MISIAKVNNAKVCTWDMVIRSDIKAQVVATNPAAIPIFRVIAVTASFAGLHFLSSFILESL